MPIKLPRDFKGFPRRKSSGNALEEAQQQQQRAAEPSFRVIARPNSDSQSLDSGRTLRGYTNHRQLQLQQQQQPKQSFDGNEDEDLFSVVKTETANRGSGGTTNSLSTVQYDSANSSRLSTSTNPSSVDAKSDKNVKTSVGRHLDGPPAPPPNTSKPSFLKNAGRAMSFGLNRSNPKEPTDIPPLPETRHEPEGPTMVRDRAMTISSVTTATPPRLVEDFSIGKDVDDDFGNMFAGIGTKASRTPSPMRLPQLNVSGNDRSTGIRANRKQNTQPTPIRSNRAAPAHLISSPVLEESSYILESQDSREGLLPSPSPTKTVTQNSPQRSKFRAPAQPQRSVSAFSHDGMVDEDTPLAAADNIAFRPQFSSPRAPPSSFPSLPTTATASTMSRARGQSSASSIRAAPPPTDHSEFDVPIIEPSLLASAQLATQYGEKQKALPKKPQSNKVMTPAEFERYKQQKEETRKYNKVFGKANSDDGSGDEYEDDEEDSREREQAAVKQRKKQEAHLAVYRQQMMKVTGETPTRSSSSLPFNSPGEVMDKRMSSLTLDHQSTLGTGKFLPDEEEEDEDVPLGILAAHGFPNKNRPPMKLMASSSNPNLRNLAQIQGGASVVGGDGPRGPLPAFARNLPVDPYYGASIVNQADRASLSMHQNASQTYLPSQPQASGAATQHPLHPAGLVGVIAGEERARAMRRGSPNPQGGYDMPQGMAQPPPPRPPMQPRMSSYGPAMGMMPPMLTPGEQAQISMSQSMQQMMQMQMQWMQQMSSMMGQSTTATGLPPQMPQMGPIPGPYQHMPSQQPVLPPPHRPQSVPLQAHNGIPNQRTMSTLSTSMAPWNYSSPAVPQISTYAPSVAPSERSNIGLATRYRPVSIMTTSQPQQEAEMPMWQKRASTFTTSTFKPWGASNNDHQSRLNVTTSIRPVPQNVDDEDDDEGWAQMKAKKDQKKKSWKLRRTKDENALKELYNTPA